MITFAVFLLISSFFAVCSSQIAIQPIFITDGTGTGSGGGSTNFPQSATTATTTGDHTTMVTTTMLGFADFVTTKDNTVIHFKPSSQAGSPSSSSSSSSSSSQLVRVIVNTKVTSEDETSKTEPAMIVMTTTSSPSSAAIIVPTSSSSSSSPSSASSSSPSIVIRPSSSSSSTSSGVVRPTTSPNDVSSSINDVLVTPAENLWNGRLDVAPVVVDASQHDDAPPNFGATENAFDNSGEVHVHIAEHDWNSNDDDDNNNNNNKDHNHGHDDHDTIAAEQQQVVHVMSARSVEPPTAVTSGSMALPTGLVTTMGGTVVQGGQTTVHETRVIGTFIDGTYAQILESTSKIYSGGDQSVMPFMSSSSSATMPPSLSPSSSSVVTMTPTTIEGAASASVVTTTTFQQQNPQRPTYSGIVRSSSKSVIVESSIVEPEAAESSKPRFSRQLSPTVVKSSPVKPTTATHQTIVRASRKNLYSNLASQRSRLASLQGRQLMQHKSLKTITADSQHHHVTSSSDHQHHHRTILPSTVIDENKKDKDNKGGRTTIRPKISTRVAGGRNNAIVKSTRSGRLTYTPNASKYYPRRRLRLKATTSAASSGNDENAATLGVDESQEARHLEETSGAGGGRRGGGPSTTFTVTSTFTTELTQFYGPKSDTKSLVFTTTYEQPVVMTKAVEATAAAAAAAADETDFAAKEAWVDDDAADNIEPTEPLQILGVSTNTRVSKDNENDEDGGGEEDVDGAGDGGDGGGENVAAESEAGYATATPPLNLELVNETVSELPPVPFSTVSEDFTTTELLHHTSLLPVFDGTNTLVYTLTQTYFVTKIVHVLKQVPPAELLPFIVHPRKRNQNDLNPDLSAAESEHQEDFAGNESDNDFLDPILSNNTDILALLNLTSPNDVNNNDHHVATPPPPPPKEQPTSPTPPLQSPQPQQQQVPGFGAGMPFFNPFLNPLAYLGLGMAPPYGNAAGAAGGGDQVVTTSRPVYSTETIYGTKVLPIWDGLRTSYHTTKAPSTTLVRTSYETYTTQMAAGQRQQQQQQQAYNNFAPMQTITSTATIVTTETLTSTQVLKLMYDGYKTSYRTLLSTSETVKTVTTQTTTTVPYAPSFFG